MKSEPSLPKSPLVSIPQYAKSKGIDAQTMRRSLKQAGMRGIGRINPAEADRLLAAGQSMRHKQPDGSIPPEPEVGTTSYNEAERRLKLAKAGQEELKLQKVQGTLVLRTAVATATFDANRRTRDKLINIPARLSGILAAESNQARIFELLTKEIHQALEDLAS